MRSGPLNLRTQFTAAGLTHFGGVYLFHRFLRQLRLRRYLGQHLRYGQRNNRYSVTETIIALMYPMILGLEKIEVSALLNTNGVFQYLTGLPSFPDPVTLRRFLVRSAPFLLSRLGRLHGQLRTHFLGQPTRPSSFWLDCDSTARTLYGNQEGVMKGYNPAHPGKKSYHPLLITEAHRSDCLGGCLRPGNAHTAEGVQDLLQRVLRLLPHQQRLRLRADAGFYDGSLLALLELESVDYAIVARMAAPLQSQVRRLRYCHVAPRVATSEFSYRPYRWNRSRWFVVLRRILPEDETEFSTTLFTLDRYAYSIIVTNLELQPYRVFQFYRARAAQERIIRTLKADYPLASAPTGSFAANALYAELSLLAYNLVIWFKRLCLPDDWQSCTLPTIRHRLLLMPGELVRSNNIPTLRFPRNSPYKDIFEYAQQRIMTVVPLC
jgi:hypothetical protein